ncbi:MAG: tetratricopeptide repeat protein, partial [Rubricoccaceae bacterium]
LTEARVTLAEAEAAAGRLAEAEATLRAAVAQDPVRHAGAWNDLGLVRLQLGRLGGAREALEEALRLDPRLLPARVNLGTALLASGDAAAAARALEAALRLDPAHVPALGNLGVAQMRLGQTARAQRTFERLLALAPGDARARAYLEQLRTSGRSR